MMFHHTNTHLTFYNVRQIIERNITKSKSFPLDSINQIIMQAKLIFITTLGNEIRFFQHFSITMFRKVLYIKKIHYETELYCEI